MARMCRQSMNYVLQFVMRYHSRVDHNRQIPTPHHHNLQPAFFQTLPIQHAKQTGEHSAHFVRDHILHHCVNQIRTPNSGLTLHAMKDCALIVWSITMYHHVHETLNIDATIAGGNTILAYACMVNNHQPLPIHNMLQ